MNSWTVDTKNLSLVKKSLRGTSRLLARQKGIVAISNLIFLLSSKRSSKLPRVNTLFEFFSMPPPPPSTTSPGRKSKLVSAKRLEFVICCCKSLSSPFPLPPSSAVAFSTAAAAGGSTVADPKQIRDIEINIFVFILNPNN